MPAKFLWLRLAFVCTLGVGILSAAPVNTGSPTETPDNTSEKPLGRLNRPRPILAILPFNDANAKAKEFGLGNTLSAMLVTEMRNHSNFMVLERSKIAEVIGFQEMSSLGITQKQIKQLDAAYQVEVALVGDVTNWDGNIEVDARLIQVKTGEVVAASSGRIAADKDLRTLSKDLSASLEKKYLRQWMGSVTIACQPVEAEVFINGDLVGKANSKSTLRLDDLLEGEYRLELVAGGYRSWIEKVVVTPKSQVTVNASLSALPGNLVLSSQPVNATVTLDGKVLGNTPLEIKNVEEGEHRLKLELPNYYPYEQKVFVNSGQSTQSNAELRIRLGLLDISSEPVGAAVFLNGRFYGKSPVRLDKVEPGQVEIEIKADGYRNYKEVFSIKPNDTILVKQELKLQVGALTVVSNPRDVKVILMGADKEVQLGKTPVVKEALNVGTYRIRLEKDNYISKELPVKILTDEETRFEETLDPKPGKLVVHAPPHTEIIVNGEFKGYTPVTAISLPEGVYNLRLNSFHGTANQAVKIQSNQETQIDAHFSKSQTYLMGALLFIVALGGLVAL